MKILQLKPNNCDMAIRWHMAKGYKYRYIRHILPVQTRCVVQCSNPMILCSSNTIYMSMIVAFVLPLTSIVDAFADWKICLDEQTLGIHR